MTSQEEPGMSGPYKWTNGGDKVLALRVINADGTSGPDSVFVNATEPGSVIICPDWSDEPKCGNGLHAWPWGHGREGKGHCGNVLWQVVACDPEMGVLLDGKAKWPRFEVVKTTPLLAECVSLLVDGLIAYTQRFGSSQADDKSVVTSSQGYSSVSATGRCSSVSATGDYSSVSATGGGSSVSATGLGSSVSATGDYSSVSATGRGSSVSATGLDSSVSATGDCSVSVSSGLNSSVSATGSCSVSVSLGLNGRVAAADSGVIVCAYIDHDGARRLKVGEIGKNGLKPGVFYRVQCGEFVECDSA